MWTNRTRRSSWRPATARRSFVTSKRPSVTCARISAHSGMNCWPRFLIPEPEVRRHAGAAGIIVPLPQMTLTPGTLVGPYTVLGPLGAGGMGEVYRARDTTLGRDVALKFLPDAFARDADRRVRF